MKIKAIFAALLTAFGVSVQAVETITPESVNARSEGMELRVQTGVTYLPAVLAVKHFSELGGTGELKLVKGKTNEHIDAALAGKTHAVAVGTAAMLRLWDKAGWQAYGLSRQSTVVMCRKDSGIKSVADLVSSGATITAPGADAIQTWGLRMLLASKGYAPNALDKQIKSMDHDKVYSAMTAKEPSGVACAATSPPYSDMYYASMDFRSLGASFSLRPDGPGTDTIPVNATFVGVSYDPVYCSGGGKSNCIALQRAIAKGLEDMSSDPVAAAKAYATHEIGGGISEAKALDAINQHLQDNRSARAMQLVGIGHYARFMQRVGAISKVPTAVQFAPDADTTDSGLPVR